ncbi:mitochondrial processing peptidase beta subunit [Lobulomyces angularis]|nr:mitochondrial processing peptidase beta subunit [Lobulomyces angularis]
MNRLVSRRFVSNITRPIPSTSTLSFTYQNSLGNVPQTRITRLANGFTIATESNPNLQTATVGVWIDAGSRFENKQNNGTAHFVEHMIFKGTKSRSQVELETQIESMGGYFNAKTSRDQTAYYAQALAKDVSKTVEVLSDVLLSSNFSKDVIEKERKVILSEYEELENDKEQVVMDHLHAIAFQGTGLGNRVVGSADNIKSLQQEDLLSYVKNNYTSERMVLAAAGGVDHDHLVKLAEQHFGSLRPGSARPKVPKANFTGSDLRARFDNHPTAHIALAVEGVGCSNPDYWPLQVAQTIIGSWDRSLGAANHVSSQLAQRVTEQPIKSLGYLANSFTAFNTSYNDTGLFGLYAISDNFVHLDDLIHHIQREWHRLALNITEVEVFRAKNQLKTSLYLGLDGSGSVCEDIGRQVLSFGKRLTPWELDGLIEKVTAADVMRVAGEYIYDREVAVVGYGPVDGLQDYNRIRAAMSPT